MIGKNNTESCRMTPTPVDSVKRNSAPPHHRPLPPHHRRCHLNLLFSYLAPWPEEEELPPRHDVIRKKESTEDLNCPGSRKNSFHHTHNHHTGLHTNFLNSVVKPAFTFGFSKSGSWSESYFGKATDTWGKRVSIWEHSWSWLLLNYQALQQEAEYS